MSESTPEPTQIETVAELAARAAVEALRPDPERRFRWIEDGLDAILRILADTELADRVEAIEQILATLPTPAPAMPPEREQQLDDLRKHAAETDHRLNQLERLAP